MEIDIQHRPAYALAVVRLEPNEVVVAEGGAMVSMDTTVTMETRAAKKGQGMLGGLLSGLKRVVAGESFFQNRFTASSGAGQVTFAPTHVGDIATTELQDSTVILQSSAFLCSGPNDKAII